MRNLVCAMITLSMCLTAICVAAETITIVGEPFPPMTNEDGTGQQFEMAKAIFEPLGFTVVCATYPYKRAQIMIQEHKADIMVGMLKVENEQLIYPSHPHDADNILAIYPKDKQLTWQGLTTLEGKRLTWARGLGFEMLFPFEYQWSEIDTRLQAFKRLLLDRDDFLIDAECGFLLEEVASLREQFESRKIGFLKIYCCFPNTAKGRELQAIWDREFLKLIDSGQAEAIYAKWGLMREYQILMEYLTTAGDENDGGGVSLLPELLTSMHKTP